MINQILQLKQEKNAIILAHYYVSEEVQKIADYIGDSFYLAKVAKESNADVIVFCGVNFMAESAKILNPDKTILMPDMIADCPMARMVKPGIIEEMRQTYDDLAVVCYINSTADLKCQSDVCVTSSNAMEIVRKLPNKNIFFIPDKNLGHFVKENVPEKNVILNDGYCPIHAGITLASVWAEKKLHPEALILSHPECEEDILLISDYAGSTADIISYAKNSDATEFIICTEAGVLYQLAKDNPDKKFYFPKYHFPNATPCCPDMKLITLEKILNVLANNRNAVIVSDEVRKKALIPLERMFELTK